MKILSIYVLVLFLAAVTCEDEQPLEPGADGFLKREHTLVRPFQGTFEVNRSYYQLAIVTCFLPMPNHYHFILASVILIPKY